MCDPHRSPLVVAKKSLSLVPGSHQYRIVYSRPQLYRTDTDRSDKRQLRPRKVRDPHIDKDRQLDDRYQDDRQRNRPQYKSDDQQDRQDGDGTDDLEVAICNIDQILGARRFSNEHALVVILFYHLIDLVDLLVYLVAGYFVFGTDDQQLIIVALDDAAHLARQELQDQEHFPVP